MLSFTLMFALATAVLGGFVVGRLPYWQRESELRAAFNAGAPVTLDEEVVYLLKAQEPLYPAYPRNWGRS
jgi:hypothetical protein